MAADRSPPKANAPATGTRRSALGGSSRKALGKGLGALIKAAPSRNARDDFFLCPIGKIAPDPHQPRQHFDDEALGELVQSIKRQGIIQPLVVRAGRSEGTYLLIAGERRLRASRRAGLTDVPVIVKEVATDAAFELALVENIQREDLNAVEEAVAYQRIMEANTSTQEQVARLVGKSRSTVANALRLLQLNPDHQQLIVDGRLSAGHARCLLTVSEPEARTQLATLIMDERLSVRQAEAEARKRQKPLNTEALAGEPTAKPDPMAPYTEAVARDLSDALKAPVAVNTRGKKGRIIIRFDSLDDLSRLSHLITENLREAPGSPS